MGLESATHIEDLVTTNPVTGDQVKQGDDHIRLMKSALQTDLPNADRPMYLWGEVEDIVSGSTTDLSTLTSLRARVTGSNTITSFGTMASGAVVDLYFSGSPQVTHNASSLITPNADTIDMTAGSYMRVLSLGSGNWKVLDYQVPRVHVFAYVGGDYNPTENATTTVTYDTEKYDVGGYFSTSTYKWTPPSGYLALVRAKVRMTTNAGDSFSTNLYTLQLKYGSDFLDETRFRNHAALAGAFSLVTESTAITNGSDSFEVIITIPSLPFSTATVEGAGDYDSYFQGLLI